MPAGNELALEFHAVSFSIVFFKYLLVTLIPQLKRYVRTAKNMYKAAFYGRPADQCLKVTKKEFLNRFLYNGLQNKYYLEMKWYCANYTFSKNHNAFFLCCKHGWLQKNIFRPLNFRSSKNEFWRVINLTILPLLPELLHKSKQ